MEAAVAGAAVGANVKVLLKNLLSFPVEEIGLLWNFNKDLEKLKKSILTIQDFLDDAETKVTDKPVQRWLMKLEAVAFNADYVFDVLNYEVLRQKVETDHKLKKKVSSLIRNPKTLLFRHEMARKIKEIKNELKSINEEAGGLGLQMRIAGAPARGAATDALAYLETDSFSMDPVFVGRENDVAKIMKMVTSGEELVSVLPIAGMGGLGKTTLARKVFHDQNIISHFGKRIWVDVSENFDPVIVLKSIAESSMGGRVDGSREVVLQKLQKSLGEEKYLLVLDNVWNENNNKWNNFITSLKGISSGKGNVIIATSRSENVAKIVKTLDIVKLGGLSEKDCWFIIKSEAFGGAGSIPSEFETIGANITKRCGGLPLAAQVVGSLLHGKPKHEWVSMEKDWLSSLGEDGNIVSKILKLSFDHLPSPSMKKCFAFCSIIPKGRWIEKDMLIHLWMGEGLLPTDQESDLEIVGNKVFNILLQSSLLQVRKIEWFGNVELCGMHDLMHDLASTILNSKFLDGAYQGRYISRPFKDESSPIHEEHAKCLRGLFFRGKISNTIFSNLKRLHVLILNDGEMKELPTEIGKLISLRFIDITHTKIECLPDSIGDLYHLQTFRVTDAYWRGYLKCIPNTFKFLTSLRHLYIPNIKLPPEIGKLSSLQTLPYFQVGEEEGCRIVELGSLKNLKGKMEIHNLEKVRDKAEAKRADLIQKPNILKLKLVWNESREDGGSNDENVLEGLQPHLNLKSLEIEGFRGTSFPLWTLRMDDFDNLSEIKLSNCRNCEEVPMLGHLPRLKSLYLSHLSNVKSMGSSFYGIKEDDGNKETITVFPALEKLKLIGMANLTAWKEVELSSSSRTRPREVLVFCRLECLTINYCRQLKSAPSHFPCLKELEICNMESGIPLASICGSKLTSTLTKLKLDRVDGVVDLPDLLFNNNRDLLELDIRNCSNLSFIYEPNMLKLKLLWNESRKDDHSTDEKVLEGLLPHRNLKSLEIEGFRGTSFQSWTLRMDFDNLLEINLSKCRNCEEVPMLGHLPRLKSLYLSHLSNVKSMGSSFYGIKEDYGNKEKIMAFPSLEKLVLIGMESLTAWNEVELSSSSRTQPREVLVFHRLECLKIIDCRQLKSAPSHFPCLKELEIESMESGVPLASICGSKLTTLTKLKLHDVGGVVCLPDLLFNNNQDLLELDMHECTNLRHLVPCLGGGGASLRKLVIWYCQNLVELPEDVHRLKALEELRISCCPNLTNLPCEMLESCALSLEKLELSGSESLTNLPEQLQHLTTLHELELHNFGIQVLPEWLERLSSLRELRLNDCKKLRHLASKKAMQGLTKLNYLSIAGCPILVQELIKGRDRDDSERSKVSHVPRIWVDDCLLSAYDH